MSLAATLPSSPQDLSNSVIQACSASSGKKIPLVLGVQIVTRIRTCIIEHPPGENELAPLLTSFSSLVFLLPRSHEFNRLFNNKQFLTKLVQYSIAHKFDHSPYIIATTYLRGDFLKETTLSTNNDNESYDLFIQVIMENLEFVENIAIRFTTVIDHAMAAINLQFLTNLYTVLLYPPLWSYCLTLAPHIRSRGLANIICEMIYHHRIIPMATYGTIVESFSDNATKLMGIFEKPDYDYSQDTTFNENLNDICSGVKKFTFFDISDMSEPEIYAKCGFTNDLKSYILQNFSASTIMTIKVFITATYTEKFVADVSKQHCLASSMPQRFPTIRFVLEIASMLHTKFFHPSNPNHEVVKNFIIYVDVLLLVLLQKALGYWKHSEAGNDNLEDCSFIMNLLKMDLQYLNYNMVSVGGFNAAFSKLKYDLTYDKIRQVQMRFLKDDQYLDYLNDKDFKMYNKALMESVKMFIVNERVLELTKGMMCYTRNPLDNTGNPDSCRAFFAISPKGNSLVYVNLPSYMRDDEEDIDKMHSLLDGKNAKHIFVKSIKKVVAEKLSYGRDVLFGSNFGVSTDAIKSLAFLGQKTAVTRNQMFTNMKKVVTKISLINYSNREFFTFYTDTNRAATLWTDTLNLLADNFQLNKVTEETQSHVEELFDIKRTLQFLPLADIYNNRIVDMYTTSDSHSLDSQQQQGNFLQVKNINFDISPLIDTHTGWTSAPIKSMKHTINDIYSTKEEDSFEYSYDELVDVASGFYYS
ncbi:hypothetical protein DASC09_013350 [Saccharomycopsis crataegensis]|uniref:Uncharacterized protein n=1 Tax=Saccharomycopsis crataegensis TaxID=43959 RepID=A0AAV5QHZ8_9ASCO|nr:hypothetical protein DASC09_013350 [Saccharomycopsis crataegensis]